MSNVNENELSTPLTTNESRTGDCSPIHSRMMRRQNTSRPKPTIIDSEPLQVSVTEAEFKTGSSGKQEKDSSTTLLNSQIGLLSSFVESKTKYVWASVGGGLLIGIGVFCMVYAIFI